jgi:2-keto-4-pentenoate hydratase/2-oxohepta-3-ene-1,7-dioic acid hydratase in catechol pathway
VKIVRREIDYPEKWRIQEMKIARFLRDGQIQFGIVEGGRTFFCDGDPFGGMKRTTEAAATDSLKILAPVSPPNIICLGLNYRKHADEGGEKYPPRPLLFFKTTTSLIGPGDPIVLPEGYEGSIDYEAEMTIVIGKRAKNVSEEDVPGVVLGYTVANDVSNREAQFKDGQWARGKSHDTFCPIGPFIVTDIDGDSLDIECRVDGKVMQSSNTSNMIFSCRQIVSFISKSMTLLPGTIILTGTPEGVGFARKPPAFLRAGHVVESTVQGIGTLTNPVVGSK